MNIFQFFLQYSYKSANQLILGISADVIIGAVIIDALVIIFTALIFTSALLILVNELLTAASKEPLSTAIFSIPSNCKI